MLAIVLIAGTGLPRGRSIGIGCPVHAGRERLSLHSERVERVVTFFGNTNSCDFPRQDSQPSHRLSQFL